MQDFKLIAGATAPDGVSPRHYGWFRGDTPHTFAANVIWVLVIFGWTMGMMWPFFFALKKLNMLRISREEELVGLLFALTHSLTHPPTHQGRDDHLTTSLKT